MKTVFVNGCFDILHAGHIHFLREARKYGDVLVVGLNSDVSVRALKGPTRPYQDKQSRKRVLEALEMVDEVIVFESSRCADLIRDVKPDIYVKAENYSLESLDSTEQEALSECGTRIVFVSLLEGYSTTSIGRKVL